MTSNNPGAFCDASFSSTPPVTLLLAWLIALVTSTANAALVRHEINGSLGFGYFYYDTDDITEIQIGNYGTATIVPTDSFHYFHFRSNVTGLVYYIEDMVADGAFFSPEFPAITGSPFPRIPRFGIFEAATFEVPDATSLALYFDVMREVVDGITISESHYLVSDPVPVSSVVLDVKPGSAENPINPKSAGVIPIAILSTATFDARTVDEASLRFGPGEARAQGKGQLEDVNRDGRLDLVRHFRTQESGIVFGDTSVSITGETHNGTPILGSDSITTAGESSHRLKKDTCFTP